MGALMSKIAKLRKKVRRLKREVKSLRALNRELYAEVTEADAASILRHWPDASVLKRERDELDG